MNKSKIIFMVATCIWISLSAQKINLSKYFRPYYITKIIKIDNRLFIGTIKSGLFVVTKNNQIQRLQKNTIYSDGIIDIVPFRDDIYLALDGGITALARTNLKPRVIIPYREKFPVKFIIPKNNKLFTGVLYHGFFVRDLKTQKTRHYKEGQGMVSNYPITALDLKTRLLIGTMDAGCAEYDYKTGKISESTKIPNVFMANVRKIIRTPYGIFLAVNKHGLFQYGKTIKRIEMGKAINLEEIYSDDLITSLTHSGKLLFVGTVNHGMIVYDFKTKIIYRVLEFGQGITRLYVDKNNLYAGTLTRGLLVIPLRQLSKYLQPLN